jgi:hypothetical protein
VNGSLAPSSLELTLTRLVAGFTTLAVASIDEDTYGYVQHLLPGTMEAIVRFRSAVISLENELLGRTSSLGRAEAAAAAEVKRLLAAPIGGESICSTVCRAAACADQL